MRPDTKIIFITVLFRMLQGNKSCEGNTAMRQSKVLTSDVTIGYIVNKSCEV